jgi:hypothetical protein
VCEGVAVDVEVVLGHDPKGAHGGQRAAVLSVQVVDCTRAGARRCGPTPRTRADRPIERQTSPSPCLLVLSGLSVKTPWQWCEGPFRRACNARRVAVAWRALVM